MLHQISKAVQETPEEAASRFHDFAPMETILAVMRPEHLPPDGSVIRKKTKWWPYFLKRKFHESGGLDAAVCRYLSNGWVIQTAEGRASFMLIARPVTGRIDAAQLEAGKDFPAAALDLVQDVVLKDAKTTHSMEFSLADGKVVKRVSFSGVKLPAVDGGKVKTATVTWSDEFITFSFSREYEEVASPQLIVRRPLFLRKADNGPYDEELLTLQALRRDGPKSAGEIVRTMATAIQTIPKDEQTSYREAARDPRIARARKEFIREGYRALSDLVRSATTHSDTRVRHDCWTGAASMVVEDAAFRDLVRQLAEDIIKSAVRQVPAAATSGPATNPVASIPAVPPEDLSLAKELVVRPVFVSLFPEGLEMVLKRLPHQEARQWILDLLTDSINHPDEFPRQTVHFVRAATPPFDERALDVARALVLHGKDTETRLAAIGYLSWTESDIDTFRASVREELRQSLRDIATPAPGAVVVEALGRWGDLDAFVALNDTMKGDDNTARLRAAALFATSFGWNTDARSSDRTERVWMEKVHSRSDSVVEAFHAEQAADRSTTKPTTLPSQLRLPERLAPTQKPDWERLAELGRKWNATKDEAATLLANTPSPVDARLLKAVIRILSTTRSSELRDACLTAIGAEATSMEDMHSANAACFRAAMSDSDASVRRAALIGLTRAGYITELPRVATLLADRDPTVRSAAASAICYLAGWAQLRSDTDGLQIEDWIRHTNERSEIIVKLLRDPSIRNQN